MGGKPVQLNRDTLVPVGIVLTVVAALVSAAWGVASDRQTALNRIQTAETNVQRLEVTVAKMAERLDYLADGMQRIELKLGTTPK